MANEAANESDLSDPNKVQVHEYRIGLAKSQVLSPALDALGNRFGTWTELALDRVEAVAKRAATRFEGSEKDPISERLAIAVVQEAASADNEVIVEYLAGVAAGSNGDDSMPYLQMVRRLSTTQLRLHYLIYEGVRQAYMEDEPANVFSGVELQDRGIWIPIESVIGAGINPAGSLSGLQNEGLISGEYGFGNGKYLKHRSKSLLPGLLAKPTTDGMILFALLAGLNIQDATAIQLADHALLQHLGLSQTELPAREVAELPNPEGVMKLDDAPVQDEV